jgi:putative salt-induced outer membrane protein
MRRGTDGFGASLLGNFGEGAAQGQGWHVTTENLQGRVRYDRYVAERVSGFLIATGRHDRFQGLDFRLNLDPGVKYIFLNEDSTKLWGELGYDFQYDIRRSDALGAPDANGNPQVDANGNPVPPLLDKTATDHSSRVFVGFKHAFNKGVTFSSGVEYLQSFVDSTRYRLNFDALVAANVGGGISFGVGFSARYDHDPLPGKEDLDTATTLSLIYAFSDVAAPPPPPPPPCVTVPPPPPSVPPAATPPVPANPVPPPAATTSVAAPPGASPPAATP